MQNSPHIMSIARPSSSSKVVHTTVNAENLPRHEARPGTRHKQNSTSNLLRRPIPLHMLHHTKLLRQLSLLRRRIIRRDRPRSNDIDRDPPVTQLLRPGQSQRVERALGSRV